MSKSDFIKRLFDVSASLAGLAVLFPVIFFIALLIKLDSSGPVFYRGLRVGRNGRPFRIFKFRSMVHNADKIGGTSTPDDDPRVTRTGQVIRKYKLDELPQLINVLTGDMSFVGPRPQVPWAVELYSEEEKQLLSVRPGITDYASIRFRNEADILKGSADPDRDYLEKIAPEKIRLGLEYVRERSLWLDIKIIFSTLKALIA
ncbi:MAG: sugar transferase [Nitrospiraceae bacterium]|nr:MAG: sugar transferase [Nitrospiraceae bacterium]